MGISGRRNTVCAAYGACVISVDRRKWESVGVVGDASLGAKLEKVMVSWTGAQRSLR